MNKNSNIKYWLLTTEYPPFFGGGISTYCYHTAKMLSQAGYEVTVFVSDDKVDNYVTTKNEDVTVVLFNTTSLSLNAPLGVMARRSYAFAQIVKTYINKAGRPDVIEAQDYQGIGYYLLQYKYTLDELLVDIPIVITLHSPAFLYLEYNKVDTYKFPDFWTCEMEKQAIISATHLISPTQFLPAAIHKYISLENLPLSVIANPYTSELPQIQKAIQKGKVLYYGKLSTQKGSFELLEYCKELWDEGFAFSLDIVGNTDIVCHIEMDTMGSIVKKRYAKYIQSGLLHLKGEVSPSVAYKAVEDAHLIIFPSIIDNLPYAVIEMMHLGKVVLASKQGGQSEIIEDGINGFLFDHSLKGDFKARLLELLEKSNEELISIGEKARNHVKHHFNYEYIFAKKDQQLKEIIIRDQQRKNIFPFLHQEEYTINDPKGIKNLLSIVIPFYNMGSLILDTIDSVLKNNYKDFEIIVVDDGSTDAKSIRVLEAIKTMDEVQLIRKKNTGLADTRNTGAQLARGEYLALLDADDRVGPDYYRKAVGILKEYRNVFFVGAWVQYFGDSKKIWPTFNPQPPYLLVHNPVNSSSLVYKKESFFEGGLNNKTLQYGLEDYDSVINMMSKGYNGVVLPEVHFFYRIRSGSMFRKMNVNKLLYSYKYIAEQHKSYYNKFAIPIINLLNSNGPGYFFDNPTEEVTVISKIKKESKAEEKIRSFIKQNPFLKRIALKVLRKIK